VIGGEGRGGEGSVKTAVERNDRKRVSTCHVCPGVSRAPSAAVKIMTPKRIIRTSMPYGPHRQGIQWGPVQYGSDIAPGLPTQGRLDSC